MEFKDKIRKLREQKSISPELLAMRASLAGYEITGGYIRKIESGVVKSPTLDTAKALAAGLDIPVSELIDKDDLPEPKKRTLVEIMNDFKNALELVEIEIAGVVPGPYPFPIDKNKKYVSIVKRFLPPGIESMYVLCIADDSLKDYGIYQDYNLVINPDDKNIVDGKLYAIRNGNQSTVYQITHVGNLLNMRSAGKNIQKRQADIEILGRVILSGKWTTH